MNHDLANIKEWLIANKLTLNKSKTEFMLIGSRQKLRTFDKSPSLVIDGAPLNRVSNTKSLGVTIDENLSWSEHIGELCKKIASGIGAIKRTRSLFPRIGRCNWYITHLYSHILTIATRCGVIVVERLLPNFKNCKTVQPGF